VPYLFADFWNLLRHRRRLDPEHFEPFRVDTRGRASRTYLLLIALLPLLGLRYDFELVQKLNSVFGALVMPMIALALLVLNGRRSWVGSDLRNRWRTAAMLLTILAFFAWVGSSSLLGS